MSSQTPTTVKVIWEEPPTQSKQPNNMFNDALTEVMGNPEKWAKLIEGEAKKIHGKAQNLRSRLRSGTLPGQEEGEWEITVRRLPADNEKAGVWVMYKPKKKG